MKEAGDSPGQPGQPAQPGQPGQPGQQGQLLADPPKRISACVVLHNNAKIIVDLLDSLQQYVDVTALDIFVVDNNSSDGAAKQIERDYPFVNVLQNERNLGFGHGHNRVLPLLKSSYHLIFNPDIVFIEDALSPIIAYLDANPTVAIVTPRILNEDRTEQHLPKLRPHLRYLIARRLPSLGKRGSRLCAEYTLSDAKLTEPTPIDCATGSFLVIRTECFKKLQGFDERFFLYFEDYDLSLRAAEYGTVVFYPNTQVVHGYARAGARSPKAFLHQLKSMQRFFSKHGW